MAELAARLADRRRVDDRGEFLQMIDEQPVEQGLVAVLQRREADVLLQVGRLGPQMLKLKRDLLLDRGAAPGQQPAQAEFRALCLGKCRVLVEQRPAKDLGTADPARRRHPARAYSHPVSFAPAPGRSRASWAERRAVASGAAPSLS